MDQLRLIVRMENEVVGAAAHRFWSKVDKTGPCWEWTGSLNRGGYGEFRLGGKIQAAHRVSWVLANGEVLNDLHVLHTCDNRKCVNPAHLWLGTNADNTADRDAKGRQWKMAKTHCLNGHAYDEVNTYSSPRGERQCRICMREASHRYYMKKRQVGA